jgi:hypothetical protein
MKLHLALGVAALLAAAGPARAQLIAYESFNYNPGTLTTAQNTGTPATGFATPWVTSFGTATVQSGSLSPDASTPSAGLTTAGNKLSLAPDGTGLGFASRTLSQPIVGTPGGIAWISVVMKGTGALGSQSQGALVFSNGTGRGFTITTGTSNLSPPNPTATWSLGDAGTGPEAASNVPNTLQSLLVARVTFGSTNDQVDLFINPPIGVTPPAASVSLSPFHASVLSTIEVDSNALAGTPTVLFDEIRIGSTFAAVVAAPVPEPTALVLVGAASLGGAIVRRHRRRGPEGD